MSRPEKGTPEYALWVAAIEVAISAPERHDSKTVWAAKVPWHLIEELREALEGVGIDWRAAVRKDRERRREVSES